jgi:hypothetical protein
MRGVADINTTWEKLMDWLVESVIFSFFSLSVSIFLFFRHL